MLNEVFGTCDAITRKFHGDIDKFVGDALVAVFDDAVDAALDIQRTMTGLNRERRQRGEADVLLRVGLNSGTVIQGEIGTSERKDLTVIGDVVNTASRIEGFCAPGAVRMSEATFLPPGRGPRCAARAAAPRAAQGEAVGGGGLRAEEGLTHTP